MSLSGRLARLLILGWGQRRRFLKFCIVGASGVVVNQGMLYLAQEYLFTAIHPPGTRLNASLTLAILCAGINNFYWNRRWTWGDLRHYYSSKPLLVQFGQYALAVWLGVVVQVVVTKVLVVWVHYLFANLVAIGLGSVLNFATNNIWTFGRMRLLSAMRVSRFARRLDDGD